MKAWIASILLKNTDNKRYWITLSLLVKGLVFFLLLNSNLLSKISHHDAFWGWFSGDSDSYVGPIDNLLKTGSYTPDLRMPGYGVIYLIPRLFFSKEITCNILIILQYLTAAISVYYLALLARIIFNNAIVFYITFYLFLFSQFTNYYDSCIMSESFCTSFLIFASYLFARYFDSRKISYLLYSGILFTWVIFLKPMFILALPAAFFILVIIEWKQKKQIYFKYLLVFVMPFTVIDAIWIARNYYVHRTVEPLTSLAYPEYKEIVPAMNFVKSWGGTYHPWRSESAVCWFGYMLKGKHDYKVPDGDIPQALEGTLGHNYFYTSKFNYDSLLLLKNMILQLRDSAHNTAQINNKLREQISKKFNIYTASVRSEKPYLYYIKSKMEYLELLLLIKDQGEKVIDSSQQSNGLLNTLYSSATWLNSHMFDRLGAYIYELILFGGIIGFFLSILYCLKTSILSLITVVPVFITLSTAIVLNLDENRYIIPMWPFLIICASYFIALLYKYGTGIFRYK